MSANIISKIKIDFRDQIHAVSYEFADSVNPNEEFVISEFKPESDFRSNLTEFELELMDLLLKHKGTLKFFQDPMDLNFG